MRRSRLCGLALAGVALILAALPACAGDARPFVRGSWAEIRAARQGRPFIVHLWGLTCPPCRVEMPQWGRLLGEKPAVDILMLHAERPPPDARLVDETLSEAGLSAAENWAFSEGFIARLRHEIDPKWQGELPMTILIEADGSSRAIVGSADLVEVRRWIAAQASRPR